MTGYPRHALPVRLLNDTLALYLIQADGTPSRELPKAYHDRHGVYASVELAVETVTCNSQRIASAP